MELLTVVCVLVAAAPAAQQLATRGWPAFITRPPGVGATLSHKPGGGEVAVVPLPSRFTPEPDSGDNPAASTPAPQPEGPSAAPPATPPVVIPARRTKVTVTKTSYFSRTTATTPRFSDPSRCAHRTTTFRRF